VSHSASWKILDDAERPSSAAAGLSELARIFHRS
jgi:hypothetical protein